MSYHAGPPLPSKPFFKTGGGIALIIVGGLVAIIGVCVFGCLAMGVLGAVGAHPSVTP